MTQTWFTLLDLYKLSLPGLPRSKNGLAGLAAREKWRKKCRANGKPCARKKSGRGGGWEYHFTALPAITVSALIKRGMVTEPAASTAITARSSSWEIYEALSDEKKAIATFRLQVLKEIEDMQRSGLTKTAAISVVQGQHHSQYKSGDGDHHKFTRATVYNWSRCIRGLSRDNWLPALAPQHCGRTAESPIDPAVIDYMRADYLRPEKPSMSACYERLLLAAPDQGWEVPKKRTVTRRFLLGVPLAVITLKRDGYEALERMFPAQKRDRTEFHALEAINADGHIWDVFVHDKDGKPYRPVTCAIQDLYSNKILAWRTGKTLGADLVRLSFGDCFRDYGIPSLCWLDNGREFAAKMVTGGTPTRFRFKVKEEEPTGFLTALGVDVRWTRPYRGQSKPIERAFRDFCDHIAKHPAFAGAYTGNMVTNKPSNYGSKSVPIAKFNAIVKAGIEAHNARAGRRTAVCQGRYSFDQVFSASYEQSVIKRASEAQLRQCLLAGEFRKSAKHNGAVKIYNNIYWAEEMADHAGERFIVRFDPDALHGSVFIYLQNGAFLCEAPCWDARGFGDAKAARDQSNSKKRWMKAQKEMAASTTEYSVADVAAFLPDIEPEELPDTTVVRPVFGMDGNAALKALPEVDYDARQENLERILNFKRLEENYEH